MGKYTLRPEMNVWDFADLSKYIQIFYILSQISLEWMFHVPIDHKLVLVHLMIFER